MLKPLMGKAIPVGRGVSVQTALRLAFVAQFAGWVPPLPAMEVGDGHRRRVASDVVPTGTVVQMPATPNGSKATRAATARDPKGVARPTPAAAKTTRVRRPEPVDEEPGADEMDELRAAQSTVRITIIGPDGQPRTKTVRLSGSRDGMAAPARRPHD